MQLPEGAASCRQTAYHYKKIIYMQKNKWADMLLIIMKSNLYAAGG